MDKVCVIGAGSSGLTAVKTLTERGIAVDCFDMASDLGGNWRYNNDNGRSTAYDKLHIDTSKQRMAYSDLPMPKSYPVFPHHTQVLAYFEQYASEFNLRQHIQFRTQVMRVEPNPDASYQVTTQRLDSAATHTQTYRAVLVCNGHHWNPNMPDFAGSFAGEICHSQQYRSAEALANKNVVIVGIGNSGSDIASEAATVAKNVYLSTRRSAYIIPRFLLGRPVDQWTTPLSSRLPMGIQRVLYGIMLRLGTGNQEAYGVRKPDHPLLSEHPSVSSDLLQLVKAGTVQMKPNIAELQGDRIRFEDGSSAEADVLINATGYKITFPFFEKEVIDVRDNDVQLYRKVVPVDRPNLYFIGLIQPLGAIMPLAEMQCQWVADLINGVGSLPDKATMQREIAASTAAMQARYVVSKRHTIQVDFFPYKRELKQEIKQSRQRATKR